MGTRKETVCFLCIIGYACLIYRLADLQVNTQAAPYTWYIFSFLQVSKRSSSEKHPLSFPNHSDERPPIEIIMGEISRMAMEERERTSWPSKRQKECHGHQKQRKNFMAIKDVEHQDHQRHRKIIMAIEYIEHHSHRRHKKNIIWLASGQQSRIQQPARMRAADF